MRRPLVATAVAMALTVPLLAAPPALADRYDPGSTSGGDPYFPAAGNGGYDVSHYDLGLSYDPATGRLDGTAVISLTATADLDSFSLDLRRLTATSVLVDGKRATFEQLPPDGSGLGGELVVRTRPKLKAGSTHTVTVVYGGVPGRPVDSGGELYGFVSTPDGALVASEPEGAATWFPVNDVPTDKATYDFRITVPEGKTAIANGEPVGTPTTTGGRTTFVWRASDPMASYLATASIGDYTTTTSTGPHGLPIIDFVERDLTAAARAQTLASLALQPRMITFFEGIYGPYPFTSYGSIVDDDGVGYALETQTRPVYSRTASETTVAHELAHQWVGNSVTLEQWRDIWLNEGFATYSQWLWTESRGGATVQQRFDTVYRTAATSTLWSVPPGDPGAADLFARSTYDRGAAALQALRVEIGDPAFFAVLRAWTTENADGNVTTADFVALSERISGQQLDAFFQAWIYAPVKPTSW
ncbi:M1 family metallopeptidase [Modestobacter sp. VKM Ac-2986]|uniref:M1 family metallopeptidase n=1 Tax=Modestobacter sp. VKM Ac-2986 TaxID=3004140 RepID=UPI0022AAD600|nr:M1 family metallopeptidase [Modestobacter sp. VKM Ac-2986]MCZ2828885.1 M1 family metallopeptidase [Modestobacter sp. VKM Ac-2986]